MGELVVQDGGIESEIDTFNLILLDGCGLDTGLEGFEDYCQVGVDLSSLETPKDHLPEAPPSFSEPFLKEDSPLNQLNERGEFFENYVLTSNKIGSGSSSCVQIGYHKSTGEQVAIKIIDKSKMTKEEIERGRREVEVLQILNGHPNICSLLATQETETKIYLVMKYIKEGNLCSFIRKKRSASHRISDIKRIFVDLAKAVSFCHSRGILHRDLKCENILIDEHKQITIIDFGLSCNLSSNHPNNTLCCGTPAYMAPEMLKKNNERYGPEVDIWSLGVVFYTMIFRKYPFETSREIRNGVFPLGSTPVMPPLLMNLFQSMFCVDQGKRITGAELLNHPWLTDVGSPDDPMLLSDLFASYYSSFSSENMPSVTSFALDSGSSSGTSLAATSPAHNCDLDQSLPPYSLSREGRGGEWRNSGRSRGREVRNTPSTSNGQHFLNNSSSISSSSSIPSITPFPLPPCSSSSPSISPSLASPPSPPSPSSAPFQPPPCSSAYTPFPPPPCSLPSPPPPSFPLPSGGGGEREKRAENISLRVSPNTVGGGGGAQWRTGGGGARGGGTRGTEGKIGGAEGERGGGSGGRGGGWGLSNDVQKLLDSSAFKHFKETSHVFSSPSPFPTPSSSTALPTPTTSSPALPLTSRSTSPSFPTSPHSQSPSSSSSPASLSPSFPSLQKRPKRPENISPSPSPPRSSASSPYSPFQRGEEGGGRKIVVRGEAGKEYTLTLPSLARVGVRKRKRQEGVEG